MRVYSESEEEALRARELVKDWHGEGLLTGEQRQRMEQETACDLRRTNIFLRLVLALFTLIIVGAGVALFLNVFFSNIFLSNSRDQTVGFFLLIFAGVCYAGAEIAVSRGRLYRHGIEEGLAACSVGFLCAGIQLAFFSGLFFSQASHGVEFLVPAAGVIGSLWLWQRFGLPYAPFAAMVFVVWLPGYWTESPMLQHLIVAAIYATGLAAVIAIRPRDRYTFLENEFSISEALLWLGIYLAINLQISTTNLIEALRDGFRTSALFPPPFYWTTWALIWCVPPVVLARGVRRKDRLVMAAGAISAVLTLATNKPYLGWQKHTWDPMLLGVLLIGVALFLRRWLAQAPGGVRHGFTAQRSSGKDKSWMSLGSSAIGLVSPDILPPSPKASTPDVHFGGGDSGGGGASSDF